MKTTLTYLRAFFLTTAVLLLIAIPFAPKKGPKKLNLPSFKEVFVSSYGDHDAIHRMIYHGLFDFGKRIAEADVLIIGNSHAELGFSAKQIASELSTTLKRPVKAFNLAVGWGEAFPFQKQAIIKQDVKCKLLLLELFGTLEDRMSHQAQYALSENKLTAYMKVFEVWSVVTKDWLFDGILPRITFNSHLNIRRAFLVGRFLAYPVGLRSWHHGDVLDYWLPHYGSTYQNTPPSIITYAQATHDSSIKLDIASTQRVLDPSLLREKNLQVMTAIVPSNINHDLYFSPIQKMGLPYINISYQDVPLYDGAHTNHQGRSLTTTRFLDQWHHHSQLSSSQAIQSIQSCRGELGRVIN